MPQPAVSISDMTGQLALLGLLVAIGLLFLFFLLGWYLTNKQGAKSPFGGELSPGLSLSFSSVDALQRFFSSLDGIENPPIDLSLAVVCRNTGRIFPQSINSLGILGVSRNYLKKRWPGHFVPWYSLSPEQQDLVLRWHGSVEGFRMDPPASFQDRPGPLYVDTKTYTLLGWKEVPDTELEVLVVQKPRDKSR